MDGGILKFDNTNINSINLFDIIRHINNNQLNWYVLDLVSSGDLKYTSLGITMSEFISELKNKKGGVKLSFLQLIELCKELKSLDECFLVGCKNDNTKSIKEVLESKSNYDYIIDYFDSSNLEINSLDFKFLESIIKSYNNNDLFCPAR